VAKLLTALGIRHVSGTVAACSPATSGDEVALAADAEEIAATGSAR
jgi:hypothetical protein